MTSRSLWKIFEAFLLLSAFAARAAYGQVSGGQPVSGAYLTNRTQAAAPTTSFTRAPIGVNSMLGKGAPTSMAAPVSPDLYKIKPPETPYSDAHPVAPAQVAAPSKPVINPFYVKNLCEIVAPLSTLGCAQKVLMSGETQDLYGIALEICKIQPTSPPMEKANTQNLIVDVNAKCFLSAANTIVDGPFRVKAADCATKSGSNDKALRVCLEDVFKAAKEDNAGKRASPGQAVAGTTAKSSGGKTMSDYMSRGSGGSRSSRAAN